MQAALDSVFRIDAATPLAVYGRVGDITPGLRVLLLTGYASIATAVEAIKQGADDYLAKPADAAAVALSEAPDQSEDMVLIVDVGTNAEILLGNETRVLACSSPTGPAFEGAQISSGQRAAPGAIERVEIDPVTKEPRFRVIGSDIWSDDPAFAEATIVKRKSGLVPLEYFKLTLKEVFISSVELEIGGGHDSDDEVIKLRFTEFVEEFVPQKEDGSAGGSVKHGYNAVKGIKI